MPRAPRLPQLPARPRDGHKGTFGRVLIVGGSAAMAGAPVLSGMAALRAGSGLVQLAVGDLMHAASIAVCPELIGLPDATRRGILAAAKQADAIAVGPGWGTASENRRTLLALLELDDASIVIDADALNLLAREKRWPATVKANLVLTPHPGEMKRLADAFGLGAFDAKEDASRLAVATRLAELTRGVVLLKGSRTVIVDATSDGEVRSSVNTTGDSSLSKAGTGDVLTGLIASLIGQGVSPYDAARIGAHVHGRAGELAGQKLGPRSVLARDVIDQLGAALRERE